MCFNFSENTFFLQILLYNMTPSYLRSKAYALSLFRFVIIIATWRIRNHFLKFRIFIDLKTNY